MVILEASSENVNSFVWFSSEFNFRKLCLINVVLRGAPQINQTTLKLKFGAMNLKQLLQAGKFVVSIYAKIT